MRCSCIHTWYWLLAQNLVGKCLHGRINLLNFIFGIRRNPPRPIRWSVYFFYKSNFSRSNSNCACIAINYADKFILYSYSSSPSSLRLREIGLDMCALKCQVIICESMHCVNNNLFLSPWFRVYTYEKIRGKRVCIYINHNREEQKSLWWKRREENGRTEREEK